MDRDDQVRIDTCLGMVSKFDVVLKLQTSVYEGCVIIIIILSS